MTVVILFQILKIKNMKTIYLNVKCISFLKALCSDNIDRPVGSTGNKRAANIVKEELEFLGWNVETSEFDVIDWKQSGAKLNVNGSELNVFVSPYSTGCSVKAPLAIAESISDLEKNDYKDSVVLLKGEIAQEQLMPKNFVFYNPEHHKKIISLLENSGARALVCATGKDAALAGGVYPFPLIEDGDFDIPSVFTTEEEGHKLAEHAGHEVTLTSCSERIDSTACNVVARKGNPNKERIIITAHIDSKKGSPGALDNASGIVVMLLLADMLNDYKGDYSLEIVALNGEDHYANPGQMQYIESNKENFENILININIDGPGYNIGETSFSFFNLPDKLQKSAKKILREYPGIVEGPQWPQGDHSIFTQQGKAAIAVTSKWLLDNSEQDITHTENDEISIVDCRKLVEAAQALNALIRKI